MKQQINKTQWEEIEYIPQEKFKIVFKLSEPDLDAGYYPTIGQMIEFLGEDLMEICNHNTNWAVGMVDEPLEAMWFDSKELCDALWAAVKHKLNQ